MEESTTTKKTFCFASGELYYLDDEQINKIPYLLGLVGAAEQIPTIQDHRGSFKMHQSIESFHFAFVLKSFSFDRIRRIFTHLPKRIDVFTIIDLYDYFGLPSIEEPTFEEIDLTFFVTKIYRPSVRKYVEKIRVFELQDMAVRFAFALARETYDGSNSDVIDQIYWFVMFILSAYDYFGPRLRHHVHRIAEHYFAMYSPAHLEPLGRVMEQEKKGKTTVLYSVCEDFGFYEEKEPDVCESNMISYLERPLVAVKPQFSTKKTESYYDINKCDFLLMEILDTSRLRELHSVLEPVYVLVINRVYERLQYQVHKRFVKFYRPDNDTASEDKRCESMLFELFQHEVVKTCIDEEALRQLRIVLPTLRKNHEKYLEKVKEIERRREDLTARGDTRGLFNEYRYDGALQYHRQRVSEYAVILNEIDQKGPFKQIHLFVICRLRRVAEQQIDGWRRNRDKDSSYQRVKIC